MTARMRVETGFLAGTRLAAPGPERGEIRVEELRPGSEIFTHHGARAVVVSVDPVPVSRADDPQWMPVRVRSGAVADRIPRRDLIVAPGQGLLVEGQLLLAAALVNGLSIVQEETWTADMFQIRTAYPCRLVADGLVVDQGGTGKARLGRDGAVSDADGIQRDPAIVMPIWAALARRGRAQRVSTPGPEAPTARLHLALDGAPWAPSARCGNRVIYTVPACAASATLVAPEAAGATEEFRSGLVALSGVTLLTEAGLRTIDLAQEPPGEGWSDATPGTEGGFGVDTHGKPVRHGRAGASIDLTGFRGAPGFVELTLAGA